jgi:hypothetical protein
MGAAFQELELEVALERLADELASPNPDLRRKAGEGLLSALREHARREKNEDSLKQIDQGSATLRALTRWALNRLSDEAYSALIMALLADPALLSPPEELITRALRAAPPKARQAAARALSERPARLWSAALCEATLECLRGEGAHFVRASLLLALGRCPDPRARAALLGYTPQGPREADALALALAHPHDVTSVTLNAQPLTLLTLPGLEAPLMEELAEGGWGDIHLSAPLSGLVSATPPPQVTPISPTHRLPLPRCARALCVVLAHAPLPDTASAHERSLALLEAWREPRREGPPSLPLTGDLTDLTYRAASPAHDPRHKRLFARLARARITTHALTWRESPSDYLAQLTPHAPSGAPEGWLLLTLDGLCEPPASYRARDVGASMSREAASAVARWARAEAGAAGAAGARKGPEGEPYQLIDPTCGSGTLLYERALLGLPEGATARGVDVSAAAIKSAAENLAALRALPEGAALPPLSLHAADGREREAWAPFDEALMNLPFGLRVRDEQGARGAREALEGLYHDLLRRAAERARPGALLVAYTSQRQLLERAASSTGWRVSRSARLLSGGLWVGLWALRRG